MVQPLQKQAMQYHFKLLEGAILENVTGNRRQHELLGPDFIKTQAAMLQYYPSGIDCLPCSNA